MAPREPRVPAPAHVAPLRPNPAQMIENAARPTPTAEIPEPRPRQRVASERIGGVRPGLPVVIADPEYAIKLTEPSQRRNAWTLRNFRLANETLAEHRRIDLSAFAVVDERAGRYRAAYGPRWRETGERLVGRYANPAYRYFTARWLAKGFFGGYFYPVRPEDDVTGYFDYPIANWLFSGAADRELYRAGVDATVTAYPVETFPYAGAYFPTETLRDLAVDASGLPPWRRATFREGLVAVTDQLAALVSARAKERYQFGDGELVVTHYENVRNEAYVIEGFIDGDALQVPFKALVDLDGASLCAAYAVFEPDPAAQGTDVLDWMNERILQLGGDPYTAYAEPPITAPKPRG